MRTVQRVMHLLEALYTARRPLSLTELAERLNLSKSTVHRLVHSLVDAGFLEQDPDTGRFAVGLRAFEIGSVYLLHNSFHSKVLERLRWLSQTTRHTVYLAVLDGADIVILAAYEGTPRVRLGAQIGDRIPAHATAVGKAILAAMPPDEVARLYETHPFVPTEVAPDRTLDDLWRDLERARSVGYGINHAESYAGVAGVGFALRRPDGDVAGGFSVSYPLHYHNEAHVEELGRLGLTVAAELEQWLASTGLDSHHLR